jgi:hypothetical protein
MACVCSRASSWGGVDAPSAGISRRPSIGSPFGRALDRQIDDDRVEPSRQPGAVRIKTVRVPPAAQPRRWRKADAGAKVDKLRAGEEKTTIVRKDCHSNSLPGPRFRRFFIFSEPRRISVHGTPGATGTGKCFDNFDAAICHHSQALIGTRLALLAQLPAQTGTIFVRWFV